MRTLVWLTAGCWLIAATHANAERTFRLHGWVQPADATHKAYGAYVLMNDPLDHVRGVVADPDQQLTILLPARVSLLATVLQPRGPEDVPVFRVVHQTIVVDTGELSANPSWSALTEEHFPAAANVMPRLLSIVPDAVPDADGDSVPDKKDVFPYDPDEWADSDKDGVGNNADPDDDNDGMSDLYEQWVGLDPLRDDALEDLDRDGMTNLEEALAGTLANDPKSIFALHVRLDNRRGRLMVFWDALASRVYGLEAAKSPSGPWEPLYSGYRPASDTTASYTLPIAAGPIRVLRGTAQAP